MGFWGRDGGEQPALRHPCLGGSRGLCGGLVGVQREPSWRGERDGDRPRGGAACALCRGRAAPIRRRPTRSWATAATNIQDAVDAAVAGSVGAGDQRGLCQRWAGGAWHNDQPRGSGQAADAAERQRPAVHGHQRATGQLGASTLANGASLSGFTLTNGVADSGGGVLGANRQARVVSNCVLVGNSAASGTAAGRMEAR